MRFLGFIINAAVKLLMFAITVSFALVKFVLGITLVFLTLGAFASSTSKY